MSTVGEPDRSAVEDVDAARRQIRAALVAKIRIRRALARRRSVQLVRYAHVGRPW